MATIKTWFNTIVDSTIALYGVASDGTNLIATGTQGFAPIEDVIVKSTDNGDTWTTQRTGSEGLKYCATSGTRFIAAGSGSESTGYVRSSDDGGTTWNSETWGLTGAIYSMVYRDGVWLICGDNAIRRRSTDNGETWNAFTGMPGELCRGLCWTGSFFAAALFGNKIQISSNGASDTWSEVGLVELFLGIASDQSNGLVAVGSSGLVYVSTDGGSSWADYSLSGVTDSLYMSVWDGSRWVIGGDTDNFVWVSTNGITWTQERVSETGETNNFYFACKHGTRTILVGTSNTTNILYSDTVTENWAKATSGTSNTLRCAFASATCYLAGGDSQTVLKSTDKISWASSTTGISNATWAAYGIANNGSRIIITGYNSSSDAYLYASDDDGDNWTQKYTNATYPSYCICFGNSIWVAGLGSGRIVRSTDNGETWSSAITTGLVNNVIGVCWSGTYFVAIANNRQPYVSTTGLAASWSAKGAAKLFRAIASDGNNNVVAVGDAGLVYSSADGGDTWTEYSTLNWDLFAVCWAGDRWLAAGEDKSIIYASTDNGATWTAEYWQGVRYLRGIAVYGTEGIIVGNAGTILYDQEDSLSDVFLDSCERYNDATDIGYQYPTNSGATISRSYFRTRQTQSIALSSGGYIQKNISLDAITVIIGAAVYLTGYPASDQLLFQMRDGTSEAIGLYVSSSGMPKVKNGSTVFITGTTAIETNKFVYIELMAVIDDTAGTVEIWIYNSNETYNVSATGQDTNRTTNGIVDNIRWNGPGAGNTYITSLYCRYWNFSFQSAENFGNIEIHAYEPIQDVINVGCLSNSSLSLTEAVDEILPITTDYLYFSDSGSPSDMYRLLHEEFNFPNPEATQEILAVQTVGLLANGNADSPPVDASFSFFWGYGSSTGNSDTQTVVADNAWLYYTQGYTLSPATSAAWANETELNDFTWGIEKV